jgi:transposase
MVPQEKPMPKRRFTPEFKESAVKLVRDRGYTVAEAAKSLGVDPNSIRGWLKKFPADGQNPATGDSALREEVRRLREENKRLLMEREILKKRRPSSRGASREIRLRRRTLETISGGPDVRDVESVAERLLCLAAASAQRGGPAARAARRADSRRARRKPAASGWRAEKADR